VLEEVVKYPDWIHELYINELVIKKTKEKTHAKYRKLKSKTQTIKDRDKSISGILQPPQTTNQNN
jgi:hypothetical protein